MVTGLLSRVICLLSQPYMQILHLPIVMNEYVMKSSILFLLLLVSTISVCQWQPTNGPVTNIEISDIVSIDSLLIASAPCGTFITENDGNSWVPASYNAFSSSIVFKDTLYLGGKGLRKFYQIDGTWKESVVWHSKSDEIYDLFADEENIYVASENFGFNYSSNGTNWQSFNTGLPQDTLFGPYITPGCVVCKVLAVDADNDYIFAGTKTGLFRSPKSGYHWTRITEINDEVNSIECLDSVIIFAANNNVYRSEDKGDTWTLIHSFSSGNAINRIKEINDTLFILTQLEGVFYSDDLGTTWSGQNNGLQDLKTKGIAIHNNEFFLGSGDGVYANFSNWSKVNNGIICSDILDLEKTTTCIAAVDFYDVFISENLDSSWTNSTISIPISVMWSVVNSNNFLFFSANYGYNSNNYLSAENCTKWIYRSALGNYGDPYKLYADGNEILALEGSIVKLSHDNGASWTSIKPPSGLVVCNDFNDAVFHDGIIYMAACGKGEVIKSSNLGTSWELTNIGLPNSEVYQLGECDGILFAATSSDLYKSSDNGNSWQNCSNGIPDPNSLSTEIQDFAYNNEYFFLCTPTGVFASSDKGSNWSDISYNLPPLPRRWGGALIVQDSFLLFGTNNFGVWQRNISNLQLSSPETPRNPEFLIYPNPTKHWFRIVLPQNDKIEQVNLFDLSGRSVPFSKQSEHILNVKHLKSGNYIIVVVTKQGRKYHMMLTKL